MANIAEAGTAFVRTQVPGCDVWPHVVDIQTDLLRSLAMRFVVPLAPTSLMPASLPRRSCPLIKVAGVSPMLVPYEAAPLGKRSLNASKGSAKDRARAIAAALDAVVSGV
ncbi:CcdB family protein [Pseudorhodoferax sp.]|uniref:CcdB family protein n=1 Tax=Pseudorhodoferax sp. TaxID=1993553 RepID=UPI0039E579AC